MKSLNRRQQLWLFSIIAIAAFLFSGCSAPCRTDQRSILTTHLRLMTLLVEGNFEQAYGLTTNDYRANQTLQDFQAEFSDIKGDELYLAKDASILSCSFNSAEVYAWHEPGLLELLNGPSFFYRKEEGQWRFTGETKQYLD